MGRAVLIIDTDPQANATIGLGIHPDSLQKHIYQYYMYQCSKSPVLLSDYIVKSISGIDIVPSHLDLIGAEAYLYKNPERYYILKQGIAPIKNRYDHILIDTPPFLGQFLINGMIAADYSVLVFSSDIFALAGYDHMNLVMHDIQEILGNEIRIGMALLNRWNNQDTKSLPFWEKIRHVCGLMPNEKQDTLYEIRTQLENRIRVEIPEVVIIPEGKEVAHSLKQGIPLATITPNDPAMVGFEKAAAIIDSWNTGRR